MTEYISDSPDKTREIAINLAKNAVKGDVFALIGQMGAGKTAFSKAFAAGLGVKGTVNSPTFTILNVYEDGRLPMYHFDAYRIEDPDEMREIGFEEYLYGDGVCVIEWADIVEDILPMKYILVKIDVLSDIERRIQVSLNGE